ncbi:MAG: L-2-hydroxyglutarate oxidase [Chloroflexi bacterium]|nr:L-2-hydroxyglutarate oxidase [Chloroflexota bacterium]
MISTQVIIVGGGIVGLATAYNLLQRYPGTALVLLEKETDLAVHQTGHNSGVLHSGIYYKPGSLKAIACRAGKQAMEGFCQQEGIPYEHCGKVIVALDADDNTRLNALHERGLANGIQCELIDRGRLQEIEPHAAGIRAIHIPETGIVDYRMVCSHLAARIMEWGAKIYTGAKVTGWREGTDEVIVNSSAGDFVGRYVVNCAGLYSDKVAAMGAGAAPAKIIPFRGEYFELKPETQYLCKGLIYPVPDPKFPFLGVHFTRLISGGVECGPNAVLAFAREGYRKRDINLPELAESLTYPGFLKLASTYWRTGAGEMWRSISKAAFVKALQRLMPEIRSEDLESVPAGVRAQAVTPDGKMLDDFAFKETPRMVHVINAPSPAATASLSIGKSIVEKLSQRF